MKRRGKRANLIVGLVLSGGLMAQFGGCILTGLGGSILGALDFCSLLGPDCVLGPLAPCGDPATAEDDLLVDCPAPTGQAGS